ncbi:MAG: hypothetical protein EOO20_08555 [Chryseobacterium sp.]|nr:MAG: hypothetical protein EOO20_08555 [Chryseobacterium sp.]
MPKDAFDVVTDVRALINITAIQALLSGGKVEPSVKTTASTVKGVVVNCLGITNDPDQLAYGSINCYAPAIISTINGKSVLLPDQAVLSTLAKAIIPLVDEQYKATFRCWIEDLPTITQDTDGSYYANIGFAYRSIQTNYTNI